MVPNPYVLLLQLETAAPGWRIVEWSDDRHFDGDHREFEVCEDLELSVYLEEVEPDES